MKRPLAFLTLVIFINLWMLSLGAKLAEYPRFNQVQQPAEVTVFPICVKSPDLSWGLVVDISGVNERERWAIIQTPEGTKRVGIGEGCYDIDPNTTDGDKQLSLSLHNLLGTTTYGRGWYLQFGTHPDGSRIITNAYAVGSVEFQSVQKIVERMERRGERPPSK
jgi:hypothetical protein